MQREILKSGGKLVDKREVARRERHRMQDVSWKCY